MVNITGYALIRSDRLQKRGGGTAIYVRNCIHHEVKDAQDCLGVEIEGTFIDFPQLHLCILCIYLPPQLNAASLNQTKERIINVTDDHLLKFPNRQIIILGDFNTFDVIGLCSDLNLVDIVDKPTRGNNILDHVLVDERLKEKYNSSSVSIESPVGKSDHATLIISPLCSFTETCSARYQKVFDYRESNIAVLLECAKAIDWHNIFDPDEDINIQWLKLHRVILDLLNKCIPQKLVKMTSQDKQWMSPLTKLLLDQKWDAFRSNDWQRFAFLKQKVQIEIKKAKYIWAQKLKERPDGLWKLTKEITGKRCAGGMESLIAQYPSPWHLAEEIAKNMSSECEANTRKLDTKGKINDVSWKPQITRQEIERHLRSLRSSKASGSDNIPNKVYCLLAPFLSAPLKNIYDCSIKTQNFPKEWKKGIVVPLPKSNPPTLQKLRMITLLPAPAKILEKLVLKRVISLLEPLYSRNQHAFRKFASTTTALIDIMDTVSVYYDDPSISAVGVLSLDLAKAFDKVNHRILLQKISKIPSLGGFTNWLASYLSDRLFSVRVQGQLSHFYPIDVGVPQGSVLGPSLFSTLVGDLSSCSTGNAFVQFADDVNIILPFIDSQKETINTSILKQLTNVENWCSLNHLDLNVDKSRLLLITRKPLQGNFSTPIPMTKSIKILGIHMSDSLQWDAHISEVTKRASQRLHVLRTLKPHTTGHELHGIYEALISSIFDYCCPAFVKLPEKLNIRLHKVEKRAHRIIFGDHNECNCQMDGFIKRREKLSLRLFQKAISNPRHILHTKTPKRLTHSQRLTNFVCRTSKRQNSFFPYVTLLYNTIFTSLPNSWTKPIL